MKKKTSKSQNSAEKKVIYAASGVPTPEWSGWTKIIPFFLNRATISPFNYSNFFACDSRFLPYRFLPSRTIFHQPLFPNSVNSPSPTFTSHNFIKSSAPLLYLKIYWRRILSHCINGRMQSISVYRLIGQWNIFCCWRVKYLRRCKHEMCGVKHSWQHSDQITARQSAIACCIRAGATSKTAHSTMSNKIPPEHGLLSHFRQG